MHFKKKKKTYNLLFLNLTKSLNITIYEKNYYEHFQDADVDGLKNKTKEYYAFGIREKEKNINSSEMTDEKFQEISEKYDSLMKNIPRWYEELKKIKTEGSPKKELNSYGLQDKLIYGDFRKFLKEQGEEFLLIKGKKKYVYSSGWDYESDKNFGDYILFYIYRANYTLYDNLEKRSLQVEKIEQGEKITSFYDECANGLNNKENDAIIYNFVDKESEIEEQVSYKLFSSFNLKKQIEIKQGYENILREIMHKANYKIY